MRDPIDIPYLQLTDDDALHRTGALPLHARWNLVTQLLAHHGHQRTEIPAPWATTPLIAWTWLVLVTNDVNPDPDTHHPLTHWGIDLTPASPDVHAWVWAIA